MKKRRQNFEIMEFDNLVLAIKPKIILSLSASKDHSVNLLNSSIHLTMLTQQLLTTPSPNVFHSTFNFYKFVSTCKKSDFLISLF